MTYYILNNDNEPVRAIDVLTWAKWFETADRGVARTNVGDIFISTVFLGIDHSLFEEPPILWESMAFGVPDGETYMSRYSSYEAAVEGHANIVDQIREKYG